MKQSRKTYFRFQRMSCGILFWNLYPRGWVQDHDMMESARIENFEKEVVRTRPHKPRSNVFVASNPRVPSRYNIKQKIISSLCERYLSTSISRKRRVFFTWCFLNISLIFQISLISSHSFGFGFGRKLCLHSFGCSNCFGRQISGILVGLEAHHARWNGETLHLKVKHDKTM